MKLAGDESMVLKRKHNKIDESRNTWLGKKVHNLYVTDPKSKE